MNPRISIIVPIYNMTLYIARCVDSVLAQSYPNLECIFVDDCGTDDSMDIVRSKIENYNGHIDFRIITHKKNKGLSGSRNTGIDESTGEYLYFLDSDDMLMADSMTILSAQLREKRVDFVVGNYVSSGLSVLSCVLGLPQGVIDSKEKVLQYFLEGRYMVMAWNKLFKKSFLLKENICFVEGMIYEDELFSFQVACLAENMAIATDVTYFYLIREGSITTRPPMKNLESRLRVGLESIKFVEDRNLTDNPAVVRHAIGKIESSVMWVLDKVGYREAYKAYKTVIRKDTKFSRLYLQSLSLTGKICYMHNMMPTPLGFAYSVFTRKFISLVKFLFKK